MKMRKLSFAELYCSTHPLPYLTEMRRLHYDLPTACSSYIDAAIKDFLSTKKKENALVTCAVLDIGCSYGLNAARFLHGENVEGWYARLSSLREAISLDTAATCDRFFFSRNQDPQQTFFDGLDTSVNALNYAKNVGLLRRTYNCNLENPLENVPDDFPHYDIWIATGCVGYISEQSFRKLLEVQRPTAIVFSCLRAVDSSKILLCFQEFGYRVDVVNGLPVSQRIFDDGEEVSTPHASTRYCGNTQYWVCDVFRCELLN